MKRLLVFLLAALLGLAASELVVRWQRPLELVEETPDRDTEREFDLLRAQFGNETAFAGAMKANRLTSASLHRELAKNLRERARLEDQITPSLIVDESEVRAVFAATPAQFAWPTRYRARHIFLAAPAGSSPEIFAAQQSAMQGLAVRLLAGEDFAQLAAEASEDDATKRQGGELNYFSAARMPPEFIAEIEKLQPGEISGPIQSHLGFHLMQLLELKPARALTFEETRAEIQHSLGKLKRAAAVARLQ